MNLSTLSEVVLTPEEIEKAVREFVAKSGYKPVSGTVFNFKLGSKGETIILSAVVEVEAVPVVKK